MENHASGRVAFDGIPRDALESAYCIFHQKLRVYKFSDNPVQKDEIEYAVSSYAMNMNRALYQKLASGRDDFLMDHARFRDDLEYAVAVLETAVTSF